jgi:hypothetical protein
MIQLNVFVPINDLDFLKGKESESFKILNWNRVRDPAGKYTYFLVETTEEEAIFLILKYGSKYVWKR